MDGGYLFVLTGVRAKQSVPASKGAKSEHDIRHSLKLRCVEAGVSSPSPGFFEVPSDSYPLMLVSPNLSSTFFEDTTKYCFCVLLWRAQAIISLTITTVSGFHVFLTLPYD